MISGKILRDAIISGANNINNQRSRVDELNVFPVPDRRHRHQHGHDRRAAVRELQAMDDSCTVGEAAKTAASAMLRAPAATPASSPACCSAASPKLWRAKREADAADIVAALEEGVEALTKLS